MAVQLRRGTQHNAEATNELRRSSQSVAFCDVGWNRNRGAPDLVTQGEMLAERQLHGQEVCRPGSGLSAAPRVERFELPHQPNLRATLSPTVIEFSQSHHSVAPRFPLPASRPALPVSEPTLFARSAEPLAARMRPRTLEEFLGQEHLLGHGKALR